MANTAEKKFEDFLVYRNNDIPNAAHALLLELLRGDSEAPDEEILPWDMEVLGEVIDAAEAILEARNMKVCDPFYGDKEKPCYLTGDCKREDCSFKKERGLH